MRFILARCVTFNSHSGQHCVWHVRQSTLDEAIQYEAALASEDGAAALAGGSAATTMTATTDITSGTPTVGSQRKKMEISPGGWRKWV